MATMLPPVRGLHEPPEPDQDDTPQGGPPDPDQGDPKGIDPEWVHYHDDKEVCSSCSYMQDGGNCSVLNMPVPPNGHCEAHEFKDEGAEQSGQVPGPEAAGGPPAGGQQ